MRTFKQTMLGLLAVSLVLGLSGAAWAGEITVQTVRAVQWPFGLYVTVAAYGPNPLDNVTFIVNGDMLVPDSLERLPIQYPSPLYPNQTMWRIKKKGIVLHGGETIEAFVHDTNDGEGTNSALCVRRSSKWSSFQIVTCR